MNIFCRQSDLRKAASAAKRITPRRPIMPAAGALLLEAAEGELKITGTDMFAWVSARMPCHTLDKGRALVSAAVFAVLVSRLPEGEDVILRTVGGRKSAPRAEGRAAVRGYKRLRREVGV